MEVIATDFGIPPLSSSVTVYISIDDVNDNVPEFNTSPNTTFSVSIGTGAGHTVGAVTATDPDSTDHGKLRYQLFEGL